MSDRPLSDHPFCQQEQEPNCFDCGDACATCAKEIERLRALLLKIRHSRLSKLDAWKWLIFEIDEALRDE